MSTRAERERALVVAGAQYGEPTAADPKWGNADEIIAMVDRTHPPDPTPVPAGLAKAVCAAALAAEYIGDRSAGSAEFWDAYDAMLAALDAAPPVADAGQDAEREARAQGAYTQAMTEEFSEMQAYVARAVDAEARADTLSASLEAVTRERDEAQERLTAALKNATLGWERAAEKDRAYGDALRERDDAREQAKEYAADALAMAAPCAECSCLRSERNEARSELAAIVGLVNDYVHGGQEAGVYQDMAKAACALTTAARARDEQIAEMARAEGRAELRIASECVELAAQVLANPVVADRGPATRAFWARRADLGHAGHDRAEREDDAIATARAEGHAAGVAEAIRDAGKMLRERAERWRNGGHVGPPSAAKNDADTLQVAASFVESMSIRGAWKDGT